MAATFTPGAFGVRADYNYVSTFDLHKPEFSPELVKRFGNQYLTELLAQMGKKIPTSALEYNHFEEDRIMPKIKATTAGAGAGAQATFTLSATTPSQNVSLPQTSPYAGSTLTNQGVPVRLNDLILIRPSSGTTSASTYIRAFVDSVNTSAGTFTATPTDSADSVPVIGSAQEIIIYGNAFGEGSGAPIGRSTRTIKYTNNVQIIKESFKITNTEKNVVTWVQFTDPQTGKSGYVWAIKGEGDTYKRFINYRETNLLISERLSNTTNISDPQASAGTPIKTTNGLIPEILANGTIANYSSILGWTITDGTNMVKDMDKQKASKNNLLLAGINLSLGMDTELKNNFQNGAINYGNFSMSEDAAVNFQFKAFQLGNYEFLKKTYDPFNDFQMFGATGYTFADEAMVIPTDKRMNYANGEMIDSLRVRYLQAPDGSGSREMVVNPRDMQKIDGTDVFIVDYCSEIGFEGTALNRFSYISPA